MVKNTFLLIHGVFFLKIIYFFYTIVKCYTDTCLFCGEMNLLVFGFTPKWHSNALFYVQHAPQTARSSTFLLGPYRVPVLRLNVS